MSYKESAAERWCARTEVGPLFPLAVASLVLLAVCATAPSATAQGLPPARMVADIKASTGSSNPQPLAAVGRTLFFAADDGSGLALWRTDETNGAVLVNSVKPVLPTTSAPIQAIAFQHLLLFAGEGPGGKELWRSDGTAEGTERVKDINEGPASSSPNGFTLSGGEVFFAATTAAEGTELWKTDGTAGGTKLVRNIAPGSSNSAPMNLRDIDGVLYFSASVFFDREPWTSDGTGGGTAILSDIAPAPGSDPRDFTLLGGAVYFSAFRSAEGRELWKTVWTNGVPVTEIAADIATGISSSSPATLTPFQDKLLFVAQTGAVGRELWVYDPLLDAASPLTNLPGSGVPVTPIGVLGNGAVFYAVETTDGSELWRTDGTVGGTYLFKDINPGAGSSAAGASVRFTIAGLRAFFAASDGTVLTAHGQELWATDGTPDGTLMVSDIWPGSGSSSPSGMIVVGGTIYFSAADATHGRELWAVDYDLTPPFVAVTHIADGTNGWNVTMPVVLQIEASDMESPLAGTPVCTDNGVALSVSGDAPHYAAEVSGDGLHLISCTATDTAGNEATATDTVKIDTTAPVIVFSGNQASYTVDQIVTITCTATDAVSQVASTTCENISRPAYEFPLGENTISATATDYAGNTAEASVAFTVTVDFSSLAALVTRFTAGSGVGEGLNAKLEAAAAAAERGNAHAETGALGAFENQVAAQTGKALTAEQAAILLRLVEAL